MKNIRQMFVAGLATSAFVLSTAAVAEVVLLPVTKSGYEPDAAVSLMFGTTKGSDSDSDAQNIIGAELSFRCVLLQMGDNQLRQQLSYTRWDDDGSAATNLELNAHYWMDVAPDTKVGAGPGLGIIMTDVDGSDNPTFLGAQVGASVHYTGMGPVFLGAEWRYQLTTEESFASGLAKDNMNNWRAAAKIGYMFY